MSLSTVATTAEVKSQEKKPFKIKREKDKLMFHACLQVQQKYKQKRKCHKQRSMPDECTEFQHIQYNNQCTVC